MAGTTILAKNEIFGDIEVLNLPQSEAEYVWSALRKCLLAGKDYCFSYGDTRKKKDNQRWKLTESNKRLFACANLEHHFFVP